MTLKDLIKFGENEVNERKYQCSYGIWYKSGKSMKKIEIKNEEKFNNFLKYLYLFYRKVELKLKNVGYSTQLDDEFNPRTYNEVIKYLHECIYDYNSMDKKDYLDMYFKIKKLFQAYQFYLNYCIINKIDINEGRYLRDINDEMNILFKNLNEWKIINDEFFILSGTNQLYLNTIYGIKKFELKLNTVNELNFKDFILKLYLFKQKIELKLNQYGYDKIYYCKNQKFGASKE